MYRNNKYRKILKKLSFEFVYYIGRMVFRNKQTPILAYHSIDDSGSEISVSFTEFKKQMKFLKDKGFISINLEEYASFLKEDKPIPSKSFILTFDDGYENNFLNVFPLLKEYGFGATIFLITGNIGRSCEWIGKKSIPILKTLSWPNIIHMYHNGISFGAHTITHPYMTELSDQELENEILKSKKSIELRVGKSITSFCYPFGYYDNRVISLVKKCGFKSACSLDYGVKNDINSLFNLKRLAIGPDTSLSYFKFIFSGFYDLNLKRKRLMKREGGLREGENKDRPYLAS